jgi:hypothetical protein
MQFSEEEPGTGGTGPLLFHPTPRDGPSAS